MVNFKKFFCEQSVDKVCITFQNLHFFEKLYQIISTKKLYNIFAQNATQNKKFI